MFIGHYALGFAAKRLAPRTSLGMLLAASLMLDILWPVFVLVAWEEVRIDPGNTRFTPLEFVSYPISHGLVAVIAWASLFAGLYYLLTRYGRGAVAVWLLVISHWILDFVTHRRDMPLHASGPLVGLGLWNSPIATVAVEGVLYVLGIWIYLRVTREKDEIGKWGLLAFAVAIAGLYVANIFSRRPPSSLKLLLIAALALGLIPVLWAWWVDRHREPRLSD